MCDRACEHHGDEQVLLREAFRRDREGPAVASRRRPRDASDRNGSSGAMRGKTPVVMPASPKCANVSPRACMASRMRTPPFDGSVAGRRAASTRASSQIELVSRDGATVTQDRLDLAHGLEELPELVVACRRGADLFKPSAWACQVLAPPSPPRPIAANAFAIRGSRRSGRSRSVPARSAPVEERVERSGVSAEDRTTMATS